MRKPLITLIILIALIQLIGSAPTSKKSLRTQLNPNYLRAMAAYKRLEPKLKREELRAITTIGILNGAKQAEERMEEHLIEVIKDLVENTNISDEKSVIPKITKIEDQVTRDQHALEVLTSAMDLAMGKLSAKEFHKEMQHMLEEVRQKPAGTASLDEVEEKNDEIVFSENIGQRIGALRQNIMSQMGTMKQMVGEKIENALEHIIDEADDDGLIAQASEKIIHKRAASKNNLKEEPAEVRLINSILSEADFRNNLVEDNPEKRKDNVDSFEENFEFNDVTKKVNANRSNSKTPNSGRVVNNSNNIANIIRAVVANITTNRTTEVGRPAKQEAEAEADANASVETTKPAKQEADSPEMPEEMLDENGGGGGGGGGIVGIISSLSGGEGGSDIGALIGALTGVISTIFGPGGLDVDSLISTGTSLIAGLLAGNKNFGTVLGMYVGTALDGVSGGGGAVNNGKFFGNFLGTVIASLSADPEEDDAPIQPFLFAENLINSFIEAKNRKGSEEEGSEERKGDPHKPNKKVEGSDSGGFIKSIVSHLVSTALGVVLNASLGAVGGASKASSSLFASSSHKSH